MKHYQATKLGRINGETCLIELFPLPSRSQSDWHYPYHTNLPYLKTKPLFRQHFAPIRSQQVRRRIEEYRPKYVTFASRDELLMAQWEMIAQVPMREFRFEGRTVLIGEDHYTRFMVIPHPVSRGLTSAFFRDVGDSLVS